MFFRNSCSNIIRPVQYRCNVLMCIRKPNGKEEKRMAQVVMKESEIIENFDFVIYNYLESVKDNINAEKMIKDFREKYDINLSFKEVNKILDEYVRSGLLYQGFRYYVWNG